MEDNEDIKITVHVIKPNKQLELFSELNDLGEVIQKGIEDDKFDPNTVLQLTQNDKIEKTNLLLIAVMLYMELKLKNSEILDDIIDQITLLLEKGAKPFFDPTGMNGFGSPLLHVLMNDSLTIPRTPQSMILSDLLLKYVSEDDKKVYIVNDLIKKHNVYKTLYPELHDIAQKLPESNYVLKTEYNSDKSLMLFRLMFITDIDSYEKIVNNYPFDINSSDAQKCLLTAMCLTNKFSNSDNIRRCMVFINHPNIDLNKDQDGTGATFLHIATQLGLIEIVKAILNTKKCDKKITAQYGNDNFTAYDIAKKINNNVKHEIIELLE